MMKTFATSIVLALLTLKSWSTAAAAPAPEVQARQSSLAYFALTGGIVFINSTFGIYPNYTISVPEDGSAVAISNPLVVYEISPVDSDGNFIFTEPYNCNFTGADGTVTHVGGGQDIVPERQVSVTCFGPSSPSSTASPATSTTISATKSITNTAPLTATSAAGNRSVPPYPTAARPSSKDGIATTSSVSAGSSGTISATAGTGSGAVTPFTGDAPKVAGSMSGGSFLAFVGLIIAAL